MQPDEQHLPAEIQGIDWQEASSALAMLTCPWYNGVGICSNGCQTEPACQTGEPEGGWGEELRRICGWPAGDDDISHLAEDGSFHDGPAADCDECD